MELNDDNFEYAFNLWIKNEELCTIEYGHISNWNLEKLTDKPFSNMCFSKFNLKKKRISNQKNIGSIVWNEN